MQMFEKKYRKAHVLVLAIGSNEWESNPLSHQIHNKIPRNGRITYLSLMCIEKELCVELSFTM